MDIEDYQEKDISGKILYLASLFKGNQRSFRNFK